MCIGGSSETGVNVPSILFSGASELWEPDPIPEARRTWFPEFCFCCSWELILTREEFPEEATPDVRLDEVPLLDPPSHLPGFLSSFLTLFFILNASRTRKMRNQFKGIVDKSAEENMLYIYIAGYNMMSVQIY